MKTDCAKEKLFYNDDNNKTTQIEKRGGNYYENENENARSKGQANDCPTL